MAKKKNPVLDTLEKAAKGITIISESDAELEPFVWDDTGAIDKDRVLELSGKEYEDGVSVAETTVEKFFGYSGDKKKLGKLAKVLNETLCELRVYKVGDIEKDVYIVGKTEDGQWAGYKTQVVET
jgi:hypothetical protein